MRNRIIVAVVMLAALVAARPAGAADAYVNSLAADAVKSINDIFDNKITRSEQGKIPAGIYRIKDTTGKFGTESQALREALFAKLNANPRFKMISLDYLDGVFDSLFPLKTLDDLSPEQLMQIAKVADIDYMFSAKIAAQDSGTVLQLSVYNVRKGALLFTPSFPVRAAGAGENTAPQPAAQSLFHDIEPEKINFLSGPVPASPIVDFEPMNIDTDGENEIAFLATNQMAILKISPDGAKPFWNNNYRTSFPARGLAGTLIFRMSKNQPLLFVSMNSFQKTIVYAWEGGNLKKLKNLDNFIADIDPATGMRLMSLFGGGRITFSGQNTYLVPASGDMAQKIPLKLPVDYYAGCILEWSDAARDLSLIAVADDEGEVQVYKGDGTLAAQSQPDKGSSLDCWKNPRTGSLFLLTTTSSSTKDSILMLKLEKKGKKYFLSSQWTSAPMAGNLSQVKFSDLDGDGLPEALGVLSKPGEANKFFYVAPAFNKAEYP